MQAHYPVEAIQSMPFSDSKAMLLEIQASFIYFLITDHLCVKETFHLGYFCFFPVY